MLFRILDSQNTIKAPFNDNAFQKIWFRLFCLVFYPQYTNSHLNATMTTTEACMLKTRLNYELKCYIQQLRMFFHPNIVVEMQFLISNQYKIYKSFQIFFILYFIGDTPYFNTKKRPKTV